MFENSISQIENLMKKQIMKNKPIPFYPFLYASFSILALFALNINEVEINVLIRPLLISFLLTTILFFSLNFILKDWQKTALYTFFILILFFTYGHVYQLFKNLPSIGSLIGRHRYLLPVYFFVFGIGSWLIIWKIKIGSSLTKFLNVFLVILVLIPVLQSGRFYLSKSQSFQKVSKQVTNQTGLTLPDNPPDIYYIILDMYTRQDVLTIDYQFDNSSFLDELKQMGFYIADCSRSNYDETSKSIASSLNLDYLSVLNPEINPQDTGKPVVTSLMSHSKVRRMLSALGYKIVASETGYAWDSWTDADIFLKPKFGSSLLKQINPFEAMIVKTTALVSVSDAVSLISKSNLDAINAPFAEHVNREEYILNKLGSLASLKGPKFVYAHILIPHYPFIFKADGSLQTDVNYYRDQNRPTSEAYYLDGYRNQVVYINSQIITIVKSIISQSKIPPIIIIQGDHGAKRGLSPMSDYRSEILNAYYLPEGVSMLYPSVSPVNSFRVVFDQYFGGSFGLLTDNSYTTNPEDPINFMMTTEKSSVCVP